MLAHIKCTDTSCISAHMLYAFLFLWIACMYPHAGISGLRSDLGSYASKFAAKSAVLLAGPFLGFNTLGSSMESDFNENYAEDRSAF